MTAERRRVLVARLDAVGDVLLAGPAVRAVAVTADVVLLVGPRGRPAAQLLPGVDDVLVWAAPWIEPAPAPEVSAASVDALVREVRSRRIAEAVLLTSFHQSALPLALLLRLAGVRRITAVSEDYPGSLLDVRVPDPGDRPEAERALAVACSAGFASPRGDNGRLAVRRPLPDTREMTGSGRYLVLHPGASVAARAWPRHRWLETASTLARAGACLVVTGGPAETDLTSQIATAAGGVDLGGRTSLAQLADVLDRAAAVVVANTGPAHLAAAVGTPVVSLFAPTVPAVRWAPYGVPVALLGDQWAPCRATRVTTCSVPGHPCLTTVTADDVASAVAGLVKAAA